LFRLTETGLQFFDLTIGYYGLAVVFACMVGSLVAAGLARRESLDPEHVWRALIAVAICGVAGARLWFVTFPPQSVVANGRTAAWLFANFFDINQGAIAVWTGGLGWFGGLLGGWAGLRLYTALSKQPLARWLDIAAVGVPLAHAVGRIGNGLAQELYGPVTTLPWGVMITAEAQRVAPYTDLAAYPLASTRFHPLFAYEALICLAIFGVVWVARRRQWQGRRAGDLAWLYLTLYGAARFLLEFWRVNVSVVEWPAIGAVNISQVTALGVALLSATVLFRHLTTRVVPSSDALP
jgi:phosphatidylglycerol:prolipoprotein diacylglycerol transferase